MNIILIGNKSRNQTELLCSQFNLIPIISTEILNDEKKSKSKLSIEISNVIQWNGSYLGNLYLDQLIDKMVGKYLEECCISEIKTGYIFNQYPRTYKQAKYLDDILHIIIVLPKQL